MLYLFFFLKANDAFEHGITLLFRKSLYFVAAMAIADNCYYYLVASNAPMWQANVALLFDFAIRPFVLLSTLFIIKRRNLTEKDRKVYALPAIVNLALVSLPFLFDKSLLVSKSYMNAGTLYFVMTHIVISYYILAIIEYIVHLIREGNGDEGGLLAVAITGLVCAIIGEKYLAVRGLLLSALLIMYAFLYLYLHIEHFKRDPMTGVLNRMSFFADLKRHKGKNITAFCEVDMNGLKRINDTLGHAAGDKAIVTMSQVIQDALPAKSYLYRLGGDEFAILFTNSTKEQMETSLAEINKKMNETDYSCAIGVAEWRVGMTFEDIYEIADRRMYSDKEEKKSKENNR